MKPAGRSGRAPDDGACDRSESFISPSSRTGLAYTAGPAKMIPWCITKPVNPMKKKAATAVSHGDTQGVMALDLARAPLSPAMAAYFDKCADKLGFVPNVLSAYAHDMA